MKTTLELQNLKCAGCAHSITAKLRHLSQVSNIQIDIKQSLVSLSYDDESVLIEIKSLLYKLGYPVIGDKNALTTKVKSFVSCAIGRINN